MDLQARTDKNVKRKTPESSVNEYIFQHRGGRPNAGSPSEGTDALMLSLRGAPGSSEMFRFLLFP